MNLVNTDKAWESLHNRLEQENLIPENKNKHIFRHILFGNIVAAAVVLLCIFVGSGIYLLSDKKHGDLLSMSNNETETSLVTTFEDGSTAYLSENTSVYYPEHFKGNERRIKVDGDALFDINREPERPFYIETEHALVKVLGTAFRINTNDKNSSFELSVKHGLVEVSGKSWSKPVLVAAGESFSLQNGKFIKRNYAENQFEKFTSKMRFKSENLDNIVKVIKQSTGTDIMLDSNDLKDLKLNVSFRNNSPETMVNVICIGLNLEYKKKDSTFHIYKP